MVAEKVCLLLIGDRDRHQSHGEYPNNLIQLGRMFGVVRPPDLSKT